MNLIAVLDLASLVLSIVVFHLVHETQQSFGGLFRQAFAIFYSVCVLALAVTLLEILGFIVPEQTPSNIGLHVFMFGILLLLLLGLSRLRHESPFKGVLLK